MGDNLRPSDAARHEAQALAQAQLALTLEAFRAWLVAQPPDEEVGIANSGSSCPVAEYLLHVTGDRWFVQRGSVSLAIDGLVMDRPSFALPVWASRFTQLVDDTCWDGVAAQQALAFVAIVRGYRHDR